MIGQTTLAASVTQPTPEGVGPSPLRQLHSCRGWKVGVTNSAAELNEQDGEQPCTGQLQVTGGATKISTKNRPSNSNSCRSIGDAMLFADNMHARNSVSR